jgi:hypothetical protein
MNSAYTSVHLCHTSSAQWIGTNQSEEVLDHKGVETTYKYVHLDRKNLRQEMEQEVLWEVERAYKRALDIFQSELVLCFWVLVWGYVSKLFQKKDET